MNYKYFVYIIQFVGTPDRRTNMRSKFEKEMRASIKDGIELLRGCGDTNNPDALELKALILKYSYLLTTNEQIDAGKVLMRF